MKNIIQYITIVLFCIGCKQSYKPLVLQKNKPEKSYFDSLSDSMNLNISKAIDCMSKGNRDSVYFYSGKSQAYLEMEGKEAYK